MDNDVDTLAAKVENFSSSAFAFVPLPWRVLFLIGLTILAWGTNLHVLNLLRIDAPYALDMSSHLPHSHVGPSPGHGLHYAIYRLFAAYSIWTFGCWLFFRALCGGNVPMMDFYKVVPQFCIIVIFIVLVCPFNVIRKRERDSFLRTLYRCLFSSLRKPILFSDVVLADILTSLAKVFGDVWISACLLAPGGSLVASPKNERWSQWEWVCPLMMSFPYLVRFKQCMVEFLASPYRSDKKALFNAIKYASAFPVIFLSFAQRPVQGESAVGITLEAQAGSQLFRVWLLAVVINSSYSFWWDVTNDWGLTLLSFDKEASSLQSGSFGLSMTPVSPTWSSAPDQTSPTGVSSRTQQQKYHPGLRPVLLFNDPFLYYIAIGFNLVLRLTWSIKLSSHLHTIADLEGGIFMVEILEIIRRWVWVYFRIEWELVRKTGIGSIIVDQHELVDMPDEDSTS